MTRSASFFSGSSAALKVQILVEKFLGAASFFLDLRAERGQPARTGAHIFQAANAFGLDLVLQVADQIANHAIENPFHGFVELQFLRDVGIKLFGLAKEAVENRNAAAYLFERQQVSFIAVVEVGGVVSNFVGQIDELGFERRPLIEQILSQFGKLLAG